MSSHVHDTSRCPLISLRGVGMTYDSRSVLEGVDATVQHGDFVAITGPNGGGKTTLLRIVLGLLRPTAGSVEYCGGCTPAIGYLPQKNSIDSHFPITVREVVASGLLAHGHIDRAERERRIDQYIDLVDLASHASQPIGRLSGGQLQRTLLARALVSQPSMLVMDEPLSYLDKQFEHRVYDIISELAPTTTIILVSHEMSRIASMANRHIIVDHRIEECTAEHHYFALDCPHNSGL